MLFKTINTATFKILQQYKHINCPLPFISKICLQCPQVGSVFPLLTLFWGDEFGVKLAIDGVVKVDI
jgi:hypothetical protein